MEKIKEASSEALAKVAKMNERLAQKVFSFFNKSEE
jgi:excinuclease UvrABC nuclease subunit